MSQDTIYVWVRWRRNSSASCGNWEWKEFTFPADCNTKRKQQAYFQRNHGPYLCDEQDSGSEHYRGVEWEFVPVPKEILTQKYNEAKASVARFEENAQRIWRQRFSATRQKEQPPIPKKACRQWPKCGCMDQGKTKDCRPPFLPFKPIHPEKK